LSWETLKNKSIMVTGGGGFIGSYLIKSLLHINKKHTLNLSVICVARKMDSVNHRLIDYLDEKNFKVILHDISNPLPNDFPNANFIIHAASQASPKFYGVDPIGTLSANSIGTLNLLNHALRNKSDKFLFISSAEVYGDPINPEFPISEKDYGYLDPMNIRACYAESKRIGETMSVAWGNQHDIYTNIVRPFHTYGPGLSLNDGRVFADFVSDIVSNRDIILKSDGNAKRTFCYISDTVSGILTVLLSGKKNEAYNIGNPETEITIKDLASILVNLFPKKELKVKFEINTQNINYLKSSISRICPSIDKLKKLGWKPSVAIKEGFTRTIESYK
jgi:UDP-glucuronate decarboxylase